MAEYRLALRLLFTLLVLTCIDSGLYCQLIAPFTEERLDEEWVHPVQISFEDNGRGYALERHGLVWIIDSEGQKQGEPLLDLREEVVIFGDHGMLGFALHPNFRSNGHIYVLYPVDRHHLLHFGTPEYDPEITITNQATIGRLTRFTVDSTSGFTTIVPGSRKVLIGDRMDNGFPVLMPSHGVGTLVFGNDGTLLVSCGDAGSYNRSDFGSASETYYIQALEDGILKPKENIGSYRSQLVDCMNGKVLRIDPETGRGLPSNPFYDPMNPDRPASKVWALGLRQPYRVILKPGTGSHDPAAGDPGVFVIGDVGRGLWEELNVMTHGGMNFGWPLYEGYEIGPKYYGTDVINPDAQNPLFNLGCEKQFFHFKDLIGQPREFDRPALTNPCDSVSTIPDSIPQFVHAVPAVAWSNQKQNPPMRTMVTHWGQTGELKPSEIRDADSGVTGGAFEGGSSIPGFFYDGDKFPAKYRDKLFVCDYSGWIRAMGFDESYALVDVDTFHNWTPYIVDIGFDPVHERMYCPNLSQFVSRISFEGNTSPSVSFSPTPQWGTSPLDVTFDVQGTYDPDGDVVTYSWDFGNGEASNAKNPEVVFQSEDSAPQRFDVILTVTDAQGAKSSGVEVVSVNNSPPDVEITSIEDGALYSLTGTSYLPLRARVFDSEHADEELEYTWRVFFHHNDHFHPEFPMNEKDAVAIIDPAGCGDENYYYRVRLEVEDRAGLVGVDEVFLYPDCSNPVVNGLVLKAEPKQDKVTLIWEFEEGDNIDHFVVERQNGLGIFEVIGQTDNGTLDYNDTRPDYGSNTYRLHAVNVTGSYTFSNEVVVSFPPDPPYQLTPNPVTDMLVLSMPSTLSTELRLRLYTPSGALLYDRSWTHIAPEWDFSVSVPMSQYPQGMYYYTLTDGEVHYNGSLVKVDR